ncbi:plasmid mobilization relaxosome protein MobC [Streptomyces fulvoviolaceus]|nr:plasmid mobilization relaxosome protein MobC [Streptomyces fulvoviolaceus]
MSKARFIAQAVHAELHGRPRLDQDDALDRLEAARIQLVRVGTNLNQIAKILNSGGDALYIARAADAVADAATEIRSAARKLVN